VISRPLRGRLKFMCFLFTYLMYIISTFYQIEVQISYNLFMEIKAINQKVIKKRLKEEIKFSGLTQKQLSEKLFVSQSCIAQYIKGDTMPSLDTFANLCRIIEADPAYILGLDN